MKPKLIPLLTLLFLCAAWPCSAQSSLSMGSYHTSPYGSYARMRLVPHNLLSDGSIACDMTTIGLMFIERPTAEEKSVPRFCTIINNAGQWSLVSGTWTQSGTNIFPQNPTNSILGIGTNAPQSKLHVSGATGDADLLIEADIDGDQTGAPSLTLKQNAGTVVGKLDFDSFNLRLQTYLSSSLHLGTGGQVRLAIDPTGNVGISDTNPDASLEVSQSGLAVPVSDPRKNIFSISSSSSQEGDLFLVDRINTALGLRQRIGIGDVAPEGILSIKSLGSDASKSRYGWTLTTGDTLPEDFVFDGGSDGDVRFVHFGSLTGSLNFYNVTNNKTPAIITNTGLVYFSDKVAIKGTPPPAKAELYITDETWDSGNADHSLLDMFWLISDEGTTTGIDTPSGCTYLNTDTIGIITSSSSQTSSTLSNGLSITGLSDPSIPALHLNGIRGDSGQANTPAVGFDGYSNSGGGDFVHLGDGAGTQNRIILRSNYWDSSGISFLTIEESGQVGIGMNAGNPFPTQRLHVRNVMRLQPQATAPECNDSNATKEAGSLYADDSGALCYCDGAQWRLMAGPGACN